MRRPLDLLLMAILISAAMVLSLAPRGGASFQFSPMATPAFAESLLVTAAPEVSGPSPDVFAGLSRMGRVVVGQYEVQPKDNLQEIAKTYGSTQDSLRSTNRLASTRLAPGKTILVHSGRGMLYQVREKKGRPETIQEIAKKYNRSIEEIAKANRLPGVALLSDNWVADGSVLFLPDVQLRFTDYVLPVAFMQGKRLISSNFGMRRHPITRAKKFHGGLDMPRPHGFPVKAAREGTVIFAGWQGGFGKVVIIKHPGGMRTWYGHLSKINVQGGQRVTRGQFIGRVGSTGLSTGPHLHFEVRDRYGKSLNPKKYLF